VELTLHCGRNRGQSDFAHEGVRRANAVLPDPDHPGPTQKAAGLDDVDFVAQHPSDRSVVGVVPPNGRRLQHAAGVRRQSLHAHGDDVGESRGRSPRFLAQEPQELVGVERYDGSARGKLRGDRLE